MQDLFRHGSTVTTRLCGRSICSPAGTGAILKAGKLMWAINATTRIYLATGIDLSDRCVTVDSVNGVRWALGHAVWSWIPGGELMWVVFEVLGSSVVICEYSEMEVSAVTS